jgi:hypothetical protein
MKSKEETRHHKAVSSAFAPMRPQINVELADRLLQQSNARKLAANGSGSAAKNQSPSAKVSEVPRVSPVHAEPITVDSAVEIVDDPEKLSPAWGFVRPFVLGVVLNKAHAPSRNAIATRDFAQIRWLAMLAIVGRLQGQCFREPEIKVVRQFLWKLVERPESALWDGCGVAYRLSKHPVSKGIEKIDLDAAGPQPFGQFMVCGPRPNEGRITDFASNGKKGS